MDIRKLFDCIPKQNNLLSFERIQDALVDWYRIYIDRECNITGSRSVFVEIDGLPFILRKFGYYAHSGTPLLESLDCFNIFTLNTGYSWRNNVAYAISIRRSGNRLSILMNTEYFSRRTEIDPRLKDSTQNFIACLEELRSQLDKLDNECGRTTHAAYRYYAQPQPPKVAFDEEWERTWNVDKTDETETETEKEKSND